MSYLTSRHGHGIIFFLFQSQMSMVIRCAVILEMLVHLCIIPSQLCNVYICECD